MGNKVWIEKFWHEIPHTTAPVIYVEQELELISIKKSEKESFSSQTGCDHPHRDFRCTCMTDRNFATQKPRTSMVTGSISCVLRG